MMPCNSKPDSSQMPVKNCLGQCKEQKHKCCKHRHEMKRKPVPSNMGWLYNAKDSPEHQLRCGWRPGHIFCPVLRMIELHKASCGGCNRCMGCATPHCYNPGCSVCLTTCHFHSECSLC